MAFPFRDGQYDGGLARRMAHHARRHEQPEPQVPQGHFLLPAQMPLEQHDQVVGQTGQAQRRLARPKTFQTQRRQGKAGLKFLDDVFAVGPAIVVTPNGQRRMPAGWQADHQRFKAIARHVQQLFAASFLVFPRCGFWLRPLSSMKTMMRSSFRAFFRRGQVSCFQRQMAFSSRWMARVVGRWQLQPICPSSRPTWSGWYLTPKRQSSRRCRIKPALPFQPATKSGTLCSRRQWTRC